MTRFQDQLKPYKFSDRIDQAIGRNLPVVCLESSVISHGLPHSMNLGVAMACEAAISDGDAVPATVGVVAGQPIVGLEREEITVFAAGIEPGGKPIEKANPASLGILVARRRWGASTVGGTMLISTIGAQKWDESKHPLVISTGGVGGVHRAGAGTLDVSADLAALASIQMVCVAAGAKSILDLGKTREILEALGVPVIGWKTEEFPAFYSSKSGLSVDASIDDPLQACDIALAHWECGGRGAILLCVPPPAEFDIPQTEIGPAIDWALRESTRLKISGKNLTPFLLAEMAKRTNGATLAANRALLLNNASVAARVSAALSSAI